jgi:formate/nitrite transporter
MTQQSLLVPRIERQEPSMDSLKPADVVAAMIQAGITKSQLSPGQLLLRGALSGALLGVATSMAFGAALQTGQPLVGSLIFPAGFVMIVILGLELVTGSFALVPLALIRGRIGFGGLIANWSWVFIGNLIGSLCYGALLTIALTDAGMVAPAGVAQRIIDTANAKTLAYAQFGGAGMLTVFVKGMLCNWLVCLGVVMAMTTTSVGGRILAAWLPILVFFSQGFEHSVVNMFVIPTAMMMGAKISFVQWWVWNQIPVTLGNIVGGFLFTGLALYLSYGKLTPAAQPAPAGPNAYGP